ncbi:MAG TPA: DNA primase [Candidatus Saccharimonadales bacterium]|nr:DNA primase [Candidatus Saccharimonadales bacterium]
MDAVEDIKGRLSVEDVVAEYVQLKRAGSNMRGLSPFTNEKTPSLMVSPAKQIWHDFSSGNGGNMFSFVMEMEGVDFRGALEILARKAGVDLDQYQNRSSSNTKLKERLYSANELSAKFYQAHFSKNRQALEYILKKRQFSKEVALAFQIGYAPNTGVALLNFLKKQGYKDEELQKAGLVTNRYRGGDMFRGRIMIPLMDPQGRVIGFTGRLLEDNPDAPKYLNTPQTLLYDKGRHVFGLHLAKDAIRKNKFAVIVEGNLDVIASHQVGITEVVATAGTAITEMHLKALSRFAHDIRLAFDQDDAGLAATERAIPIAHKTGVHLSIIDIVEGKDPDELIKKDPSLWSRAITQNQDAQDWLIAQYEKRADLSTYSGRDQFKQAVLSSVKRLENAGEQGLYAAKVAKILGYSEDAIKDELKAIKEGRTTYRTRQVTENSINKTRLENKRAQDHLLAISIFQPPLRYHLNQLTAEMMSDEEAIALLEYLHNNPDFKISEPAKELKPLADYVKILGLQYEELYQDLGLLELRNEATRLQIRLIESYVKTKKKAITEALRDSNETESAKLLEQAKSLDELLKVHN